MEENIDLFHHYGFNVGQILSKNMIHKLNQKLNKSVSDTLIEQDDVMLFPKHTDYLYHLEKVKKQKLPLIPFVSYWLEGTMGVEDDPTTIEMTPMMLTMSEENNVLFYQGCGLYQRNSISQFVYISRMPSRQEFLIENIYGYSNWNNKQNFETFLDENSYYPFPEHISEKIKTYLFDKTIKNDVNDDGFENLDQEEVCLMSMDCEDYYDHNPRLTLKNEHWDDCYNDHNGILNLGLYFECHNDFSKIFSELVANEHNYRDKMNTTLLFKLTKAKKKGEKCEFYTLTKKDNKLVFDENHIEKIQQQIWKTSLISSIRKQIELLDAGSFCKQTDSFFTSLCNETGYGNTTLIKIHGFMRME